MFDFGETKVGDFDVSVSVDEDVVGVEIAVYDGERLCRVQIHHALRDRHRPTGECE